MKLKLIITSIILLISQLVQADVSVSVDRNPIVSDEAFKLIFETPNKQDGQPDFSPLEQNFTILSTGRSSNTKIINGDVTRSQQWILTVLAKQSGVLPVPSISFGSDASKATSIEVLKSAPSLGANSSDDVLIKAEVDTKSPYVQAQVIYTAKVLRSVQTNNAQLFDPVVSSGEAIIKKFGEDKNYEKRLNGKRYVVTERQFVIFPQNSGKLKIEPIMFQAQIGSSNFFNFDPFGPQPKSVVKQSDSIEIDVKPIPDSFTGSTWLPAKQLSIQEQWSVDPAKLNQGEATTRTLTLNATGLPASNLPDPKIQLPAKLKQYPDQPEFSETIDKKSFVSLRHDKMAVIPVVAGDYVLPAVKVPWWNTLTDKMEIAELPERTIHVNGSVATPVTNSEQAFAEEKLMPEDKELVEKNISTDESINVSIDNKAPWKWLSIFLFVLWLITLFAFWKYKRKPVITDMYSSAELSKRQYLKKLKQSCIDNEPAAAKQALLDWSRNVWPNENIICLNSIKPFCDKELETKLDELNLCLYGKNKSPWDGASFLKCFQSQSFFEKSKREEKGNLEPLYKA
jgi:hypothetical protein